MAFAVLGSVVACRPAARIGSVDVVGVVENAGPLTNGADVVLRVLADDGSVERELYTVADALGSYRFEDLPGDRVVRVEATGESPGTPGYVDFKTRTVTLRAVARLASSGTQTINVNVATHIIAFRVLSGYLFGLRFETSRDRAEHAFIGAVGGWAATMHVDRHATEWTTRGTTDADAFLLAWSLAIGESELLALRRGEPYFCPAPDVPGFGYIADTLNLLADAFGADGGFDVPIRSAIECRLERYARARETTSIADVLRLGGSGDGGVDGVVLRDPGSVIDSDGDSFTNKADDCPADADPGQGDADGDGIGDVCDDCPATRCPPSRDACVSVASQPNLGADLCFDSSTDGSCTAGAFAALYDLPAIPSALSVCTLPCSPVSSAPCVADEACVPVHAPSGSNPLPFDFGCVAVPMTARLPIGATCQSVATPCEAGAVCRLGRCSRLCASSADCGADRCAFEPKPAPDDRAVCRVAATCPAPLGYDGFPRRLTSAEAVALLDLDRHDDGPGVVGAPSVAGCGATDVTGGVDAGLSDIATALAPTWDLVGQLSDALRTRALEVGLGTTSATSGGLNEVCFEPSLVIGTTVTALPSAALFHDSTGFLDFQGGTIPIPWPLTPRAADCDVGGCRACAAIGCAPVLEIRSPTFRIVRTLTPHDAILEVAGTVFFGDADPAYAGVSGFGAALANWAAAVNLRPEVLAPLRQAFVDGLDARLDPSMNVAPCAGAAPTSTDRNAFTVGLRFEVDHAY